MLRAIAAPLLATTLGWIEPGALQPGQRGTCVTEWEDCGKMDADHPDV